MSNIKELLKKRLDKTITDREYVWLENHIGQFSGKQLVSLLKTGDSDRLREVARDELMARGSSPHWTLVPTFFLVVIGTIAGVFAAVIGWMVWKSPAQSNDAPIVQSSATAPVLVEQPAQETPAKLPTQPAQSLAPAPTTEADIPLSLGQLSDASTPTEQPPPPVQEPPPQQAGDSQATP